MANIVKYLARRGFGCVNTVLNMAADMDKRKTTAPTFGSICISCKTQYRNLTSWLLSWEAENFNIHNRILLYINVLLSCAKLRYNNLMQWLSFSFCHISTVRYSNTYCIMINVPAVWHVFICSPTYWISIQINIIKTQFIHHWSHVKTILII